MTKIKEAVSLLLIDPHHSNRTYVAERISEPYLGQWTFPGGKVDVGELPLEAAIRELEEETGLIREDFHKIQRIYVGLFGSSSILGPYIIHGYLVNINPGVKPKRTEPDKHSAWIEIDMHNLPVNLKLMAGTEALIGKYKELVFCKG